MHDDYAWINKKQERVLLLIKTPCPMLYQTIV
jgi:hypothetical protein